MRQTAVQVLSIHDDLGSLLAFDLKDVLDALFSYLDQWVWCVTGLDAHGGPRTELFCAAVEQAGPEGKWVTSRDLAELANDMSQTIEGTFLALPRTVSKETSGAEDVSLAQFPATRAELAVTAVDGAFFEIYVKDAAIADLVRQRFHDVRDEDPAILRTS